MGTSQQQMNDRMGEVLGQITAVTQQGAIAQPVPTTPRSSAAVSAAAATSDPWASAAAAAKTVGMTSVAVGSVHGMAPAPMQLIPPTPGAFIGDRFGAKAFSHIPNF